MRSQPSPPLSIAFGYALLHPLLTLSLASVLAPPARRTRHTSTWPLKAAQWRAVCSY